MNRVTTPAPAAPRAAGDPAAGGPARRTRRTRRVRWADLGEPAAFVALVAVFWLLNPGTFATVANAQTILNQAALPLMVAVGATLVVLMGSIDLSVEGVMGAAGMTFVLLSANSRGSEDLGVPVALLASVAVGTALGLAAGVIHTRLRVPSFIVTLGIWYVGLGVATLLFGESAIPFLADEALKAWPNQLTLGLPHGFLAAAVLVLAGAAVARYTRIGRNAYAIGDNEQIAAANGLAVGRTKIVVFAAAGACSALAGVLASVQLGAGSATVGIGTLFLTLAAVVIGGTALRGGRGGILRSALGVLLLTTLNNGLILSGVSPNIQSGVSGAVLVVAIIAAAWPHRSRLRVTK